MAWFTELLWFASAAAGQADYTAFVDPNVVVYTRSRFESKYLLASLTLYLVMW